MSHAPYAPLAGVRKIVALRPNAIGDFMFSLPALHALRDTYPEAHIVLLGKQWHADFLCGRPSPVDQVIVMPPFPGVGGAPDAPVDPEPGKIFIDQMRAEKFDLAVQMFGGGRYSNAFISSLGARLTIGARTPEAAPLDRSIAYGAFANRRLELLQVAALAGARPTLTSPEIGITANDRQLAAAVVPHQPGQRLVVLHPGASDPRRRWPAERYAAVADALASAGATIAISATEAEADLARAVVQHMREPALDLSGRLSLPALCGLIERAEMMLSNDTGPLHLAIALNTPAVGIFWLTNLMESCPLRQHLLFPALSLRTHCPVCGEENRKRRCAHDVSFVDDVEVDDVAGLALGLFSANAPELHDGLNDGFDEGLGEGLNDGLNARLNKGLNEGLSARLNEG